MIPHVLKAGHNEKALGHENTCEQGTGTVNQLGSGYPKNSTKTTGRNSPTGMGCNWETDVDWVWSSYLTRSPMVPLVA